MSDDDDDGDGGCGGGRNGEDDKGLSTRPSCLRYHPNPAKCEAWGGLS